MKISELILNEKVVDNRGDPAFYYKERSANIANSMGFQKGR